MSFYHGILIIYSLSLPNRHLRRNWSWNLDSSVSFDTPSEVTRLRKEHEKVKGKKGIPFEYSAKCNSGRTMDLSQTKTDLGWYSWETLLNYFGIVWISHLNTNGI